MSIGSYTIGSTSFGGRVEGSGSAPPGDVIITPPGGVNNPMFTLALGFGAEVLVNSLVFPAGSDTEPAFALILGGDLSENGSDCKVFRVGAIWRPIRRT